MSLPSCPFPHKARRTVECEVLLSDGRGARAGLDQAIEPAGRRHHYLQRLARLHTVEHLLGLLPFLK
eukprot:186996-Prymnesium_polylepis.1